METATLKELKAVMPYQWRIQDCKEYGATCVAYIDSRDVQNRLDDVVGPENWQSDYKDINGKVYGGIAIKIAGDWVWKWDCGSESNVEKEKGEASDAFKRAAVKWGVGRFLYDLEIVKLKTVQYEKNQKWYPKNEKTGKPIFDGKELTEYITGLKGKGGYDSSYNHNKIGTPEKPLISGEAFKKALDRIKKGELEVYQKVLDSFTLLDATQTRLLEATYNTAKKQLQTA